MKYRKIPELDWLKDIAYEYTGLAEAKKVDDLYRYLLWSRRYQLVEPQDPLRKMYFGLMLKYCRRLYPGTTPYEQQEIRNAEKMFKAMKSVASIALVDERNPKLEQSISSKKRSLK